MKKLLLILILITVLVCASCADADVHYIFADNHIIEQEYSISIDSIDLEARTYADAIKGYWSDNDFDADVQIVGERVVVSGDSAQVYENRQSAATAYSKLLTSEDSMLSNVVFKYVPSYELDTFSLSATLSLVDIIRQNEIQDIPAQDLDALLSSAHDGEYTFSVSLPGEIVSTNADVVDGQKCTWNLQYGSETTIELEAKCVNEENISAYAQLKKEIDQSTKLFRISIAAASVLALALLLFFVIRRIKNRPL